jgi:hypothetical protein
MHIVSSYTKRSLTFDKDRLLALEGTAVEIQKTRLDEYCMGVWSSDLPRQLLWHGYDQALSRSPPELEIKSWSWASTKGSILFWYIELEDEYENICTQVAIESGKTISMHCPVKVMSLSPNAVNRTSHAEQDTWMKGDQNTKRWSWTTADPPLKYAEKWFLDVVEQVHAILDDEGGVVGLAILDHTDNHLVLDSVVCAVLIREPGLSGAHTPLTFGSEGDDEAQAHDRYYVLLLRPVDTEPPMYSRVGSGVIIKVDSLLGAVHESFSLG